MDLYWRRCRLHLPSVVDPWRSGAAESNLTLLPTLAATVVVIVIVSALLLISLPPLPLWSTPPV